MVVEYDDDDKTFVWCVLDSVSGTSKQKVAEDYAARLVGAKDQVDLEISKIFQNISGDLS